MELKNFISNCRNPKFVVSKRGEHLFVPCGHCADCANKKAVRYTAMTMNASREFRYVYMVTLKYDEINVPRMYLKEFVENGNTYIECKDITRRKLKNGKYKKLKTYGKTLHVFEKDAEFDEFYKRADIDSKLVRKLPFKNLRWCCKEDVQNFFKRLRFHLSKVCDSEMSYFAVSEYGPQTFRPHFHILLYFDDWRAWQYLRECCLKSWKLGSIRTECPDTNEGVCSYVSSYLNSTTYLPRYLDAPAIKPRSFHSRFLGTMAYKEIRDFVYNSDGYPFEKATINTSFGPRDIILTSDVVRTLYPRCYSFSTQSTSSLFELYTIYRTLREYFGNYSPTQLAKICYNLFHRDKIVHSFLTKLGLEHEDIFEYAIKYGFEESDDEGDMRSTIFNRIYTSILTSKHFLNFVCDNWYDDEIRRKIDMICDFYESRDKYLLTQQYKMQEEYSQLNPPLFTLPTTLLKLIGLVDLDFIKLYERNMLNHYMVFYPIHTDSRIDYVKEILKPNPIVRVFNTQKDEHYSQKVKHKELNDANGMFL